MYVHMTSSAVPDLEGVIHTASDDGLALDRDGRAEVRVDIFKFSTDAASMQVPRPHRLIVTHRQQELSIWMEAKISHPVVVTHEGHHALARLRFPQLDGPVA